MDNPYVAGLAAGYSPQELLDHASTTDTDTAVNIAKARGAGYRDEEIVQHLAQTPTAPPPSGSLNSAVGESIRHGIGGPLASSLAWATRGIERATGRNDPNALASADNEDAYAADQQRQLNANYQRPADVPASLSDAVTGASGVMDGAKRVGQDLLYGAAENAGPLAANLGVGLATGGLGEAATAGGALLRAAPRLATIGADLGFNAAGARQEKIAAGLDGSAMGLGDAANVAGQTTLLGTVGGAAKRFVTKVAEGAVGGAIQPVFNAASAALQGGTVDPAQVASQALDAGALGGTIKAGHEAASASAHAVGNMITTRQAGPNMRAFANEVSQPAPAPAVDPSDPTAPAPSRYSAMSPEGQNGMAELATVQMYDAARQAMTTGLGKPDFNPAPAQVFKNITQAVSSNLSDFADGLKGAGLISRDAHGDLKDAIAEARKHNVTGGQNGAASGYFDTLQDKVAALPIDPTLRDQGLQMLRVLDIASQNSLYKNSKGLLERNAGLIGPALLAGAAGLTHGAELGGIGAMGGLLLRGQTAATLRYFDGLLGNQQPDILRRSQAIQDFAARNGLSPVADPQTLQRMTDELRGLGQQAPLGPDAAARQQQMNDANALPVTSRPGTVVPPVSTGPGGPIVTNPADAITPRVVRPPAPQAPEAAPQAPVSAPPATLAGAMGSINDALASRAARLSQAAEATFPSARRGWSAAVADTLGVQHDPMMEYVRGLAAQSPELAAALQAPTVPNAVMRSITNHVADMRDQGRIPRATAPQEQAGGGGIRNPISYAANVRQAEEAQNAARAGHPDVVAAISATKTKVGRGEVLDQHLASLPPEQRAATEAILRPLTAFGAGPRSDSLKASEAPTASTLRAGGASPRNAPTETGMGSDPTRRNRGGVAPEQVLASKRFKTDRLAPGEPMEGLPRNVTIPGQGKIVAGPDERARTSADAYMKAAGQPYNPPKAYAKVDPERAARIAKAFDQMKDDPHNPQVRKAYGDMIHETLGQWQEMKKAGFKAEFMPDGVDHYAASPRLAVEDMQKNNHAFIFSTEGGFGSKGITDEDRARNPMLQTIPGETWGGKPVLANDIFRAVHDYYGHAKEGVGFRADGEENAFRSHAAMFSPDARRALTTETRGQNSWLNYGPHGEHNRTARTEDTIFADQKIGLMPEWTTYEGNEDFLKKPTGTPDASQIGEAQPGIGHNGGPAMPPDARQSRLDTEQAARAAQDRATELLAKPENQPTKAERAVLLHDHLDGLDAGQGATKRGRSGVDVSEQELQPARAAAGLAKIDWHEKGSADKAAGMLYKEALYHLSKTGNALGWYDSKLKTAMNMLGRVYPELNTDPRAQGAFKAMLAVTSNGINVVRNFETAHDLYAKLRSQFAKGDYTLPLDAKFEGKTANSQRAAFRRWNTMIAAGGIDKTLSFMSQKFKAGDLEKIVHEETGDTSFHVTGESKKALVYGASMLGPKIGNGFFSNLNGRYDMPTMDRWLVTTFSRLTGGLVKRDTASQSATKGTRVQDAMKALSRAPDLSSQLNPEDVKAARKGDPEALQRLGKAMWTLDNREGFPRTDNGKLVDGKKISPASDEIRKAFKTFHQGIEGARIVSPEGAAHRMWLRDALGKVVDKLNTNGIPISMADLQAVIWFPEQRYWQQKLGVGSAKTDADYEDGATIALLNRGHENHIRDEYAHQGYSPAEIKSKIDARRGLAAKLKKEPIVEDPEDDEE